MEEAGLAGLLTSVLSIGLLALDAVLLTTRGQDVAKLMLGVRVVRPDGRLPGFARVVLLRTWLFILPCLPGFFSTAQSWYLYLILVIDPVFIFRADRRCVHDHLAGTLVVRSTLPV